LTAVILLVEDCASGGQGQSARNGYNSPLLSGTKRDTFVHGTQVRVTPDGNPRSLDHQPP
jgi:hypothetical protein